MKEDGRTRKALLPDVMGLRWRFNMSGFTDSIRERRAREIRRWEEEEWEEEVFEDDYKPSVEVLWEELLLSKLD